MDRLPTRETIAVIALPATVKRTLDLSRDLAGLVGEVGSHPVIVTDSQLAAAGVAGAVESSLGCEVITVPLGEPTSETVSVLAHALSESGADVVVAVGGGSVIDSAKLAGRLVADPSGLTRRLLSANPFPPGAAVVALPTTSGSGAEVTRTAIVFHGGHKTWAWDERLRPELAVLAPELTASTPRSVAVAAGLDAFVHAVEAATGQRATAEITRLGFTAAGVLRDNLPNAIAHPERVDARVRVMDAATAAGVAIDQCGTGIGHAVGHALASIVRIPHGLAVMLGFAAGLEWTLETSGDAYRGLASALGSGVSADTLPAELDMLLEGVGFWAEVERYAPPTADQLADEMASPDHQPMCKNNARVIGSSDLADIAELVVGFWSR
ncbi:MAG: iron-containing alcohol dehydrogenase [Acidimicrobiia bacterium]